MTEAGIIKRKIYLKRQSLKLILDEIEELQERLLSALLKERLKREKVYNDV